MAGVNVYLDPQGLNAEGVTSDTPVTLNLTQPISLKSALNLMLSPLGLSYVIQNEVLRITSEQTRDSTNGIRFLGLVVSIIMGLGAVFAALNTMYAAVSARSREIATLRAIGFRGFPVVLSVLIEAMVLALAGGLLGALIAYVLFNGMTVSTLGGGFTQLVFAFKVTPAFKETVVKKPILTDTAGKTYQTSVSIIDPGSQPAYECGFPFRVPLGTKVASVSIDTATINIAALDK